MNRKQFKKLCELKAGDTLYCIAYKINDCPVSIVELTVAEVITDGPHIEQHMYSREGIRIKEKVPNSPEKEGEYYIDQYSEKDTHRHGIYTTYVEAFEAACDECHKQINYAYKKVKEDYKEVEDNFKCLKKLELDFFKNGLKL